MAVGPLADEIAARRGQVIEDGDIEQEFAKLRALALEHITEEVGRHQFVIRGELVDERTRVRSVPHRQQGQFHATGPAFGTPVEQIDVGGAQLDPVGRGDERRELVTRDAQLERIDLAESSGRAQPGQLPGGLGAR